jgi:fumarylacetoacetate (FAA) hydrolase family protein
MTAFSGEFEHGTFIGRVWRSDLNGPSLATVRDGVLVDVTSGEAPTMRDLLEMDDPVGYVRHVPGAPIGRVDDVMAPAGDPASPARLLSPFDLQAIKACGVTFARSMIERVIEERAAGDADLAQSVRARVTAIIGDRLNHLKPGSDDAKQVKAALIEANMWSQYLEVGIGPDAEVFTKSQPLSSVGHNADVGLHPGSLWNNPEPEVVLAVDSKGRIKGATLGNDVNLRDFEGRSALLLGKAKDNNASCAIGPFIRLFDAGFTLDDVRQAEVLVTVDGVDGFRLDGRSSMAQISRDPQDLTAQTIGRHHQYPDGFALFLGTMFAPIEDRGPPGEGFTHKTGDIVRVSNERLGVLENKVVNCDAAPPWRFGIGELMSNLAGRGLLSTRTPEAVA